MIGNDIHVNLSYVKFLLISNFNHFSLVILRVSVSHFSVTSISNPCHLEVFFEVLFVQRRKQFHIAKLKENCELQRYTFPGKKSDHILMSNGGYCVYYPSNIGEYHSDICATFRSIARQ